MSDGTFLKAYFEVLVASRARGSSPLDAGRLSALYSNRVVARYSEPWRRYHGVQHAEDVCANALVLGKEAGLGTGHLEAVFLAGAWHDAIQFRRGKKGDSERASADYARSQLDDMTADGLDVEDLKPLVPKLILETIDHEPHRGPLVRDDLTAAMALVDADLWSFGVETWEEFVQINEGIREEYQVPEYLWNEGRVKFLSDFVWRSPFYYLAGEERTSRASGHICRTVRETLTAVRARRP